MTQPHLAKPALASYSLWRPSTHSSSPVMAIIDSVAARPSCSRQTQTYHASREGRAGWSTTGWCPSSLGRSRGRPGSGPGPGQTGPFCFLEVRRTKSSKSARRSALFGESTKENKFQSGQGQSQEGPGQDGKAWNCGQAGAEPESSSSRAEAS